MSGHLRCEKEYDSESEDKACNAEIHPLHALQAVVVDVLEENEGCENRRDNGTDGLESLSKVETELHPPRGTAGSLSQSVHSHYVISARQLTMKGLALVSRVERPEPTTNIAPQKPPKDRLTPLGQKRRAPTP